MDLNARIVSCQRCPRLREHCARVASEKRRSFADWDYWGKPVPNFGDPSARILVVGLAPAAHGGNRTGRMFTGDESGNWLFHAMHEAGLASQPDSLQRGDGLVLTDVLITAAAHCAPPDNKPTPEEFANCREWLVETMRGCSEWKVLLALGKMAFDHARLALAAAGIGPKVPASAFKHGAEIPLLDERWILCSYHPSQRNTYTGLVTREMLRSVLLRARELAG